MIFTSKLGPKLHAETAALTTHVEAMGAETPEEEPQEIRGGR